MPHGPDQSTIERPGRLHNGRRRPVTDSAAHRWDEEIRRAGLEALPSKVMNRGVPLLAIGVLAIVLLLALIEPVDGIQLSSVVLIMVAIAPWGFWLSRGDEGPHWQAITALLLPIAVLNIGNWFVPALGPGSENGYPGLAFPPLLLTILAVAIAPARLAMAIPVAAWAVMGLPMYAAHVTGKDITGTELVTWHVAVALCIAAGYAIRFSNHANAAVTVAREMMVRQEASEERRQIARDVHDVVAHSLSVTLLHVTAARLALTREDTASASHALAEAERLGRSSVADIRCIVQVLRADGDSPIDLPQPTIAQVDELVETYRRAGLEVDLTIAPDVHETGGSAGLTLYRILQEALTNAARHGHGPVTVGMTRGGDAILLSVSNAVRPGSRAGATGSGIAGMKERAAAAGGTWTHHVANGRWVVTARIPNGEGP